MAPEPTPVTGLRRIAYAFAGLAFVGLAVLGVLLPLLPSTPFLLLASYFFVRSSPALNAWLLRNRWFGPVLRDWQRHGAVRPWVKFSTLCMLLAVLGTSALVVPMSLPLLTLLGGLGLIGFVVVARLPVVPQGDGKATDQA